MSNLPEDINKALGRIEASQDHHATLLKELSGEHRLLHSDNAALKTQMRDVERRISRLEPDVQKNLAEAALSRGVHDQERRDEAATRSAWALIASAIAVGWTLIKDIFWVGGSQ